jgi:hypothetical protein
MNELGMRNEELGIPIHSLGLSGDAVSGGRAEFLIHNSYFLIDSSRDLARPPS